MKAARRRRAFGLLAVAFGAAAAAAGPAINDPSLGLPAMPAPKPAQVALGRALFFERGLSVNGTLSCAMCHVPEQGFTANELRTSVGMEGVSLRRNAPTLLNVAHVKQLFHDGRASSLEQQALIPIVHPKEMANPSLAAVVRRVASWPAYKPLFQQAFGTPQPSSTRIAQALAAYQRTLVAGGSRFDRWRYGGERDALSAKEQRGFGLFQSQGCASCHRLGESNALFTDHRFHNTGIQARSDALGKHDVTVELIPGLRTTMSPAEVARVGVPDDADLGRQEVTGRAADTRAFRTPSLRNVALTAPYMHNGALATLNEVLEHYSVGGWPADAAQNARIKPLALTHEERDALVAFLESLTAESLPRR